MIGYFYIDVKLNWLRLDIINKPQKTRKWHIDKNLIIIRTVFITQSNLDSLGSAKLNHSLSTIDLLYISRLRVVKAISI